MPHRFSNTEDWYAIMLRLNQETILCIDRSLGRGWRSVRLMCPELGPRDLAFRLITQDEFDNMPEDDECEYDEPLPRF